MGNKFLKILTRTIIIIAIIVGVIFIFSVYTKSLGNNNDEQTQAEKVQEEIKYLDNKILTLVNSLNNIEMQNYRVILSKVETEGDSPNSQQKEEGSSGQSGEGEENGENKEETTISEMERNTIIEDKGETDWKTIEGELQILGSTWTSIVLDLYKVNVSAEDIVEFSNNINNATMAVKNQDKNMSAMYLAKMYSYLPEFSKNIQTDEIKKETLLAKTYIINAYGYVQTENWDRVETEVEKARNLFSGLVNNANLIKNDKKYNVNKAYIVIEELKNSLTLKQQGIFYTKYKNAIEELNVIL